MTINRIFLSGILLTAFSVSFAAESNKSVRELYDELLELQKDVTLEDLKKEQVDAHKIRPDIFHNILKNAQRTGLNKQYQHILTVDMPSPRDIADIDRAVKNGVLASIFTSFQNLRIIACLQRIYGQNKPFTYSNANNPEEESDKVPLAFGMMSPYYSVLGTYITPEKKELIVTQYSFFNGLIDTIMYFEKNPQFSSNRKFTSNVSMIKKALIEAINVSRFYACVRDISWRIGRSHKYSFLDDLAKEVIPAMKRLLGK